MHDAASSITGLAIVVLAALACGMAMQRLKQPAVMGYILAGALLGPGGLAVVENREFISLLAELGVLMLLFLIGMELSLRAIRDVWFVAAATTALQIAVGLIAMFGLGALLDWPLPTILLFGFCIALSSTAVAIKMLEEIGELRSRTGQVTVAILIAQDLAVVPMMLILQSFRDGGTIGGEAAFKVLLSVGFLGLLIVYLLRRERLRLPFARVIGRNQDLLPLAGLAFCFGAAALSGLLGLSAAYGAFLAGLVIGNSTSRKAMIHHTLPIQAILLMVFFLSIGLLIDFAYILDNLGTVVAVVAFVALAKTALNVGVIRLLGQPWTRAFLSGALLAQLGEFSFVLAALGLGSGIISNEDYRLIVAITVLSLLGSPFWLATARRLHRATLLGITSSREILRLTYGEEARFVQRTTLRAEHALAHGVGALARRLRRGKTRADADRGDTASAENGGEAVRRDA
ncbi:MAG TPA: cation:proton antiporter [Kiloniellales bacterium]|nr:cation:proton antiporter [Kiloniellales bacterium]